MTDDDGGRLFGLELDDYQLAALGLLASFYVLLTASSLWRTHRMAGAIDKELGKVIDKELGKAHLFEALARVEQVAARLEAAVGGAANAT